MTEAQANRAIAKIDDIQRSLNELRAVIREERDAMRHTTPRHAYIHRITDPPQSD